MKYSKHGYKRNSKDVNNPYNVIPSGNITMKGVDFPVMGTDNLGNQKLMMPGANYTFPGNSVYEVPLQNFPRHIQAQRGFEIAQDARMRNDIETGQNSGADMGSGLWGAITTGYGTVADYYSELKELASANPVTKRIFSTIDPVTKISNALDILSVPGSLVAEAVEGIGGQGDGQFNITDAIPNMSGDFSFTNINNEPLKNVAGVAGVENPWAAFALNLATDPTTYVGAGIAKGLIKKGVTRAAKTGLKTPSIVNKSNFDISKFNITGDDIKNIAVRTRERLLTDKFIKNNMAATGRTRQEVIESIDNFTNEFDNSIVYFEDIGYGPFGEDLQAAASYVPGKITVNTNKITGKTRENVLGNIEHELEHMFSDVGKKTNITYSNGTVDASSLRANNKIQKSHPVLKASDEMPANNQQYFNLPYEQQVRFRKAIRWMEDNIGLKVGDDITDEHVKKLTFAMQNWTRDIGADFAGKGGRSDVYNFLMDLNPHQFLKEGEFTMLKRTPINSKGFREGLKDILNKTYATIPAAGVGTVLANQQQGGSISDTTMRLRNRDYDDRRDKPFAQTGGEDIPSLRVLPDEELDDAFYDPHPLRNQIHINESQLRDGVTLPHEVYHWKQRESGNLFENPYIQKHPEGPVTDERLYESYNRREKDLDRQTQKEFNYFPESQMVPNFTRNVVANQQMYQNPETAEGEAHAFESMYQNFPEYAETERHMLLNKLADNTEYLQKQEGGSNNFISQRYPGFNELSPSEQNQVLAQYSGEQYTPQSQRNDSFDGYSDQYNETMQFKQDNRTSGYNPSINQLPSWLSEPRDNNARVIVDQNMADYMRGQIAGGKINNEVKDSYNNILSTYKGTSGFGVDSPLAIDYNMDSMRGHGYTHGLPGASQYNTSRGNYGKDTIESLLNLSNNRVNTSRYPDLNQNAIDAENNIAFNRQMNMDTYEYRKELDANADAFFDSPIKQIPMDQEYEEDPFATGDVSVDMDETDWLNRNQTTVAKLEPITVNQLNTNTNPNKLISQISENTNPATTPVIEENVVVSNNTEEYIPQSMRNNTTNNNKSSVVEASSKNDDEGGYIPQSMRSYGGGVINTEAFYNNGGEAEIDMNTYKQLVAAGAKIEIL